MRTIGHVLPVPRGEMITPPPPGSAVFQATITVSGEGRSGAGGSVLGPECAERIPEREPPSNVDARVASRHVGQGGDVVSVTGAERGDAGLPARVVVAGARPCAGRSGRLRHAPEEGPR